MTLSGYFTSNSVFVSAVLDSEGSTFKDNYPYVKSNKRIDPYYQRQNTDSEIITLVSGK